MNYSHKHIKFALYARKSQEDKDRQMLSIESQLREMKDYANKEGIKIHKTFIDSGSAHKVNNRPQFIEMMEAIQKGEIDGILVWKSDRLARNMIEGGQIIYLLQNSIVKVIQTQHQRYLPSDNTLPLTIDLGMSNQFSIDLSRNIKRGNKTKTENGGWCSVAPHGYLNDRVSKTVVIDQNRYNTVRKIWDYYLTGSYSLNEICKIADKEWNFQTIRRKKSGGKPLSVSSLHKILTNPFYYGLVRNGDIESWGQHKRMVTKHEFEEVQRLLRRSGKSKPEKYQFSFTGCMKCGECGSSITAEEKVKYFCPKCSCPQTSKNPHPCKKCGFKITDKIIESANWYTYYRCTKKKNKNCTQKCIRERDLEPQIMEVLDDLEIDKDFEQWAIRWLRYIHQENAKVSESELKILQKSLAQAHTRKQNLLTMRMDNEISQSEYEETKRAIEGEETQWKDQIAKSMNKSNKDLKEAEDEFNFIEGILKRFQNGTIQEKKFIFSKIGSNLILEDKKLALDLKKEYLLMNQLKQYAPNRLEPPETLCSKEFLADSECKYPMWYTR